MDKQAAIPSAILACTLMMILGSTGCSELLLTTNDGCPNNCDADIIIIGCDDRVVRPDSVDSTTDEPWNFIGRFDGVGCTGTLIADRFVLTAAHCTTSLNDTKMLGFALGQKALHVSQRPYGTHGVRRVFVPASFALTGDEEDRAYDYAVAELFEPIAGANLAPWGYVAWSTLRTKPVFAAGYPGTQPDGGVLGRPWMTTGSYHSSQPFAWLDGGESGLLYTDLDGTGGQSGSPVYSFLLPSEHRGLGIIRFVSGVQIGSPVAACMADQHWVSRLTPGAVEHIENVIDSIPDNWWNVIDLAPSPTSGPNEAWP